MKAALINNAFVLLALVFTNQTMGQDRGAMGGPIYPAPMYYDHASTWEEGVLRGRAEVLRGAGEWNYNNSLAAINAQEAYGQYLDNRLKAASTYFDLRKLNREARAEERGQRATPEKLAELAHVRVPDRLAAHQLDPAARRLIWPAALNDAAFAAERAAIDRLMEKPRDPDVENRKIQTLARAMTEKLRTQVGEMKPSEYVAAKRFLTSLDYEMNFVGGATAVAVR